MAWTAPRTFVAGEIITAAIMNTHVKDQLRYLKGLDGVPTIESGLIIDNTGGDEYLQIPSLTTTERNALTAVNGMIIYNETTTEFNKYEAGAWVDLADNTDHGGLDGLGDDDHTQYQKSNLLTTQGDTVYATGASTWARLAKGTANQLLAMNAGATAPEWKAAGIVFVELAGGESKEAGGAAAWEDWDISATVPAGASSVLIGMGNTANAARSAGARKNGSALSRLLTLIPNASGVEGTDVILLTECDANRVIEIYAQIAADIHFGVLGYWI